LPRREEQAVVVLLEPETKAGKTQSDSPALNREQALVERADDLDEIAILGLKVIVEASDVGLG
jgi:hypothetical protein